MGGNGSMQYKRKVILPVQERRILNALVSLDDALREAQKITNDAPRQALDCMDNQEATSARDAENNIAIPLSTLKGYLSQNMVYSPPQNGSTAVDIGTTVVVEIKKKRQREISIMELHIIGIHTELDRDNEISCNGPVGMALIGRRAGNKVRVDVPAGTFYYKIISINPYCPTN